MAEYIKRSYIRKMAMFEMAYTMETETDAAVVLRMIEDAPAADVEPVVHSYWEHKITSDGENIGICHNCKYPVSWFLEQAKYCPNCGAKMDGGEHGKT